MAQRLITAVPAARPDVTALPAHLPPMFNALEYIRANPIVRRLEIGELLFAQFSCLVDEPVGIWTQTDYLINVLTGTMEWKDFNVAWSAAAGHAVYFKKGAKIIPAHSDDDTCLQLFFIPDAF